jgi:predicted amidophosphoribosyltransferase
VTSIRLQAIDDTNRRDHHYLREEDECYFLYEYTAGKGWQGGETNQLIHNLKKKRADRGHHHKAPAIARCAGALSSTINGEWLGRAALIPIPPSKIRTDINYDDRISQICRGIKNPGQPDVRELIEQIKSTDAFHEGHRLRPEELRANYTFAEQHLENFPVTVGVVDDLLTTGSHFRAVKDMIKERAPDCRVVGFFVARRAIPNPFDEISIEDLLK